MSNERELNNEQTKGTHVASCKVWQCFYNSNGKDGKLARSSIYNRSVLKFLKSDGRNAHTDGEQKTFDFNNSTESTGGKLDVNKSKPKDMGTFCEAIVSCGMLDGVEYHVRKYDRRHWSLGGLNFYSHKIELDSNTPISTDKLAETISHM